MRRMTDLVNAAVTRRAMRTEPGRRYPGWLLGTALALPIMALSAGHALAQAWPAKPIRLIVAVSPGGNTDTIARVFASKLSESAGQPVTVENKPGASGTIGTDFVVRSAPDGYTLLVVGAIGAGHTMNPSLFSKLPYDTTRDLVSISGLTRTPLLVAVHPSVPAASLKELIDLAKSKPGEIAAATGGAGGATNLATELLMSMAGIKLNLVHYKGNAPALNDTLAGVTSVIIDTYPTALAQVKAGRLRALAITGQTRSAQLPDVPTVAEAGVPGYEMSVINGLFAPAATPRSVVSRIAAEVEKFARNPEARQFFAQSGSDMVANRPEEFSAMVEQDIAKWHKIIKAAGIRLD
ncbi:MAG: Bug family tripartite tricarboxylate transporter substrate binding protein [Lautropia sp.]